MRFQNKYLLPPIHGENCEHVFTATTERMLIIGTDVGSTGLRKPTGHTQKKNNPKTLKLYDLQNERTKSVSGALSSHKVRSKTAREERFSIAVSFSHSHAEVHQWTLAREKTAMGLKKIVAHTATGQGLLPFGMFHAVV